MRLTTLMDSGDSIKVSVVCCMLNVVCCCIG